MHLGFGNLAKIRGIVYFRLSAHEQKAFAGAISHGVPNMIRRFKESVFKVVPRECINFSSQSVQNVSELLKIYCKFAAFLVAYMIIDWANNENERLSRKNPKDYENDK